MRASPQGGVRQRLSVCEVAPVTKAVISDALGSDIRDFEDAVLEAAAHAMNLDGIVTRDRKGFVGATLPIYPSDVLVAAIRVTEAADK